MITFHCPSCLYVSFRDLTARGNCRCYTTQITEIQTKSATKISQPSIAQTPIPKALNAQDCLL